MHVKSGPTGLEVRLTITGGKFHLGRWEAILCGAFDRNRRKRVLVKIIGE